MNETNNNIMSEWFRWGVLLIFNIGIVVSSIIIAYGTLDKRLTVVETKQEQKVDAVTLQLLLKEWKDEIVEEIKAEINKKNVHQYSPEGGGK